jgi:radical SAM superfamily enzyme YgiQ (UPF0313 family)
MPAAIGGIATFYEANVGPTPHVRLFKYPEKLIDAIKQGVPHIIGFSNYCWNLELGYGFAEVFKEKYPDTVVVMGGPNYPVDAPSQEQFMRERSAIDFLVVKEGELPFSKLVEALIAHDFDVEAVKNLELDSIHSVTADGRFIAAPLCKRLADLTDIPSPYLTGKMDEFFDGTLMPILQTNRGCPFSCTYCTEGNLYFNRIRRKGMERIAAELDYMGKKMVEERSRGGRNDLFITDSNFGMFKKDLETCRLIAQAQKLHGWPEYIIVGTGKNKKGLVLEAARIVSGRLRLAGSVQSLDPQVLSNISRSNVDTDQLLDLATDAKDIGANSYAEVILALPGDTVEKHLKTIETLIDVGFADVYMFQLMMLLGAVVSTPTVRRKYKMGTHFRVIPRCFGSYQANGKRVIAVDIEEIATSLDTFTFEDYLSCRRFNLIVTIFYNDRTFEGLLKLLENQNISRYTWIENIFNHKHTGRLAQLISDFVTETEGELWNSREELVNFTRDPGTVERYINDELGANLLFKYQSLATNRHLLDVAHAARVSILEILRENNKLTPQIEAFVDDILTYDVARRQGIFEGHYGARYAELHHDVPGFLAAPADIPLSELAFDSYRKYHFALDNEQIGVIERALNTYGRTDVGMARILARVHVKKLLRHASPTTESRGRI